jgi:BirA family transcriptional regulator, biotin operon repressor / biotin---[acetyl-CoA-carboxylase] ligase
LYKIPATTLFLGKNLIFMPECPSTNDAMLLLCQSEPTLEGTVIITSQQTAGKGQRGNVWKAEAGKNLTFTVMIKPAFLPAHQQFYLNIFVSLAVRDYLTAKHGLKVQIKWPNDILADGKKLCGILIENQISGSMISLSAIGIGLNINQQQFEFSNATSVLNLTGQYADLASSLDSLLQFLEARYLQLKSGKTESLRRDYLDNLFLMQIPSRFSDVRGVFRGTIKGIDEHGRLLVDKDGRNVAYDLKEIQFLTADGDA